MSRHATTCDYLVRHRLCDCRPMIPMNPECQQGKHGNCNGVGGLDDNDNEIPCPCDCHAT